MIADPVILISKESKLPPAARTHSPALSCLHPRACCCWAVRSGCLGAVWSLGKGVEGRTWRREWEGQSGAEERGMTGNNGNGAARAGGGRSAGSSGRRRRQLLASWHSMRGRHNSSCPRRRRRHVTMSEPERQESSLRPGRRRVMWSLCCFLVLCCRDRDGNHTALVSWAAGRRQRRERGRIDGEGALQGGAGP
jgi:hypothetical protein